MLRRTAKTGDNSILNEELDTRIKTIKLKLQRLQGAFLNWGLRIGKVDFEVIRNLYEELEVGAVY